MVATTAVPVNANEEDEKGPTPLGIVCLLYSSSPSFVGVSFLLLLFSSIIYFIIFSFPHLFSSSNDCH